MTYTNEVLECIIKRRSTRKYTGQQVPSEMLDAMLEAAIWAPSGGNNQTWLFTAIQKPEVLAKLNGLVREGFQTWVPDDDYPGKHRMKEAVQNDGYCFYFHAPTLVIASNVPHYENAMADCSLGMENLFIAAESMKLGTCYVNQLHWLRDDPGVRAYLAELGVPREHTICSAAAVGYIAAESPAPARKEGTINIIR